MLGINNMVWRQRNIAQSAKYANDGVCRVAWAALKYGYHSAVNLRHARNQNVGLRRRNIITAYKMASTCGNGEIIKNAFDGNGARRHRKLGGFVENSHLSAERRPYLIWRGVWRADEMVKRRDKAWCWPVFYGKPGTGRLKPKLLRMRHEARPQISSLVLIEN